MTLIGARNKELLILIDELRAISEHVIVTTDDGSYEGPESAYIGNDPSVQDHRKLFGLNALEQMAD